MTWKIKQNNSLSKQLKDFLQVYQNLTKQITLPFKKIWKTVIDTFARFAGITNRDKRLL